MKPKILQLCLILSVVGMISVQAQVDWADTLDRADWVVLDADNELEAKEGAIDGDFETRWATTWDPPTPLPHYITIDLGDFYEISELIYLPRQDQWGPNGTIKNYTIVVSNSLNDINSTAGWFVTPFRAQNAVSGILDWPEPIAEPNNRDEFKDTVAMEMSRPLMGRYLRVYCDSAVTAAPECIITELWAKGRSLIDRENMLSNAYWSVIDTDTALTSEQRAIDNDLGTFWSTPWEGDPVLHPHHIVVDFTEEVAVDSVLYIARQDIWGSNGTVSEYEIYVSNDTEDWGVAAQTGTIDYDAMFEPVTALDSSLVHKFPYMLPFDATATGRYLKFVALSSKNGDNESIIAELSVYGAATGANYTDVTDLIANPSFELGPLQGWGSNPWGGMTYKDTSYAFAGDSAALMSNGGGSVSQLIELKANTRYELKFAATTSGFVDVGMRTDGGTANYLNNQRSTDEAAWTEHSYQVATNADATTTNLYFWSGNGAGQWAMLDDFMLAEIGPANFSIPEMTIGDDVAMMGTDTAMVSGTASDMDGDDLTWAWTADAGVTLEGADTEEVTVIADDVTEETVVNLTLTVSDGRHAVSEVAVVTISVKVVEDMAPIAVAGDDQTVAMGATVTLDGSGSSDPESAAITYLWTAPDGITLDDPTAVGPTFTAPADLTATTTYEISLVVNDGTNDSDADAVVITVTGPNALDNHTVNFDLYPNPSNGLFTLSNEAALTVSVLDMTGRSLFTENYEAGINSLDLTSYGKGLYLITLREGNNVSNVKVVVE